MNREEQKALISQLVKAKIATLVSAGVLNKQMVADANIAAYLTGNLSTTAIAAEDALWRQMVQAFTLPANEVMLREAREMATRKAAELVTNMTGSELRSIGETIARGLERGDGPQAIARRLDMVRELDGPRAARMDKYIQTLQDAGYSDEDIAKRANAMREKMLRERRETIARTETANAIEESNNIEAKASGRKFKTTITSQDDKVSDICLENEAAGWIPIEQDFPSGHSHAPHHPNCRCATTYATYTPTDQDKARQEKRHERTKAARELAKRG